MAILNGFYEYNLLWNTSRDKNFYGFNFEVDDVNDVIRF